MHIWNYYQLLFSYNIVEGNNWQKKIIIWRLKQDQLKLKRESKTKKTNKSFEFMSLKSENNMNLKEKIRDERKDLNLATEEKKSIEREWRKENKDDKRKECIKYRYIWVSIQNRAKSIMLIFSGMLMILLMYKNIYFNTNNFHYFIPNVAISLL